MTENDIFRALADPTRRAIFEKLADGAMNASSLREGMEISQPAMSQHLSVLRGAGLVVESRQGRFVNYQVDPEGLTRIAAWLGKYRAYWPQRIDALKLLLNSRRHRACIRSGRAAAEGLAGDQHSGLPRRLAASGSAGGTGGNRHQARRRGPLQAAGRQAAISGKRRHLPDRGKRARRHQPAHHS